VSAKPPIESIGPDEVHPAEVEAGPFAPKGNSAGPPALSESLRDELLHALDDAIELAVQTGRAVLAADLRRLRARLAETEAL
jgi:hypothetical protein